MSIGGLVLNCRRRMSRTRQDTRTGKPPQSRAFVGVKVPTKSKDDKIVEKVTTLEPYDKKILAKFSTNCNIYCKLVLLIKLDTQVYYNMRIILGLEYK